MSKSQFKNTLFISRYLRIRRLPSLSLQGNTWWKWITWEPNRAVKKTNLKPPENKFETTGLTPINSDLVNAPYVGEFPVVLECKLIKHDGLGLHSYEL